MREWTAADLRVDLSMVLSFGSLVVLSMKLMGWRLDTTTLLYVSAQASVLPLADAFFYAESSRVTMPSVHA